MAQEIQFFVGAEVEVYVFCKWRSGIISAVLKGQGPEGEDLYNVEYDQETPEGMTKSMSGAKSAKMLRKDDDQCRRPDESWLRPWLS